MNRIREIVFLVEHPPDKRDYQRFGIELLRANGFEVSIWDFTPVLNPRVFSGVKIVDSIDIEGYRRFESWSDALASVGELQSRSLMICLVGYQLKSLPLYRAMSKCDSEYAFVMVDALPAIETQKCLSEKIARMRRLTVKKMLNALFSRIPYRLLGISPAAMVLVGGERSLNCRYPIGASTEVLSLHCMDYDNYLQGMGSSSGCGDDLQSAVFLDEYLPFHPDYLHLGIPPFMEAEEYYALLRKFFDDVERAYGVKVVIAAHPRSQYEEHPDYFDGRPVIKGESADLVRKSKLVIAHSSTAINYAVLFKKPIIFVTADKLKQCSFGKLIAHMASCLGREAINLSEGVAADLTRQLDISEDHYARYRKYYIKKEGTPDVPLWQLFADQLKCKQ